MALKIILDNFQFRETRSFDCLYFKLTGIFCRETLLESFNYFGCHEASRSGKYDPLFVLTEPRIAHRVTVCTSVVSSAGGVLESQSKLG